MNMNENSVLMQTLGTVKGEQVNVWCWSNLSICKDLLIKFFKTMFLWWYHIQEKDSNEENIQYLGHIIDRNGLHKTEVKPKSKE